MASRIMSVRVSSSLRTASILSNVPFGNRATMSSCQIFFPATQHSSYDLLTSKGHMTIKPHMTFIRNTHHT